MLYRLKWSTTIYIAVSQNKLLRSVLLRWPDQGTLLKNKQSPSSVTDFVTLLAVSGNFPTCPDAPPPFFLCNVREI